MLLTGHVFIFVFCVYLTEVNAHCPWNLFVSMGHFSTGNIEPDLSPVDNYFIRRVEGESLTLRCELNDTSSNWTIHWYRSEEWFTQGTLGSTVKLPSNSSTGTVSWYTLAPLTVDHTGYYACRAEGGEPFHYTLYSSTTYLHVAGKSLFLNQSMSVMVSVCVRWGNSETRRPSQTMVEKFYFTVMCIKGETAMQHPSHEDPPAALTRQGNSLILSSLPTASGWRQMALVIPVALDHIMFSARTAGTELQSFMHTACAVRPSLSTFKSKFLKQLFPDFWSKLYTTSN